MAPTRRPGATRPPVPKRSAAPSASGSDAGSSPSSPTGTGGGVKSNALYLTQMAIVTIGIYVCFFAWGVMHERVAGHEHVVDGTKKKFKSYLVTTLFVGMCTTLTSLLCLAVLKAIGSPVAFLKPDVNKFMMMGGTMTFAGPLSLTAAKNLSYPLYLTVKMCKMVPSVIVGVVWYRFKYTPLKYLAVVLITAGVLGFSLLSEKGDSGPALESQSEERLVAGFVPTSVFAVIVAFLGMTLDGYTVSTQDAINKETKGIHSLQLMLGAGLSQTAWCIMALLAAEFLPEALHNPIVKPELQEASHFFREAPQALYDIIALGFLNSFGQVFVLTGVGLFGGLTLVALMTTRKVGSVFISIAVHGHSVTMEQWGALLAVVGGVVVDTVDGVRNKNKKAKKH